jgi:hypothetical protein
VDIILFHCEILLDLGDWGKIGKLKTRLTTKKKGKGKGRRTNPFTTRKGTISKSIRRKR